MNKHKAKLEGLKRRQRRVRGKVSGTSERPRLRVTRTNANIYAQIIDDSKGSSLTLVSASTLEAEFKGTHTSNKEAAEKVGQLVGKRAIEAGIRSIIPASARLSSAESSPSPSTSTFSPLLFSMLMWICIPLPACSS